MSDLVVHLPARLRGRLDAEARRRGRTPEQFVRDTLSKHLKPARPAGQKSLYARSRDLCGCLTGGREDLARSKVHW